MSILHPEAMTSNRRKWMIGLALLAMAVIPIIALLQPNKEPSYKGKSLSEWIVLRSKTPGSDPDIEEAIAQIGTNGVPYYVKWLGYEQPSLKASFYAYLKSLLVKAPRATMADDQKVHRATGAALALETLGPKAVIALYELARLATGPGITSSSDELRLVAVRATLALPWLGEQALPPLLYALTNRENLVPWVAAEAIGNMGSNALPAIPTLAECAASTNGRLAWKAMDSLGRLQLEPDRVVLVLVDQLNNLDPFHRTCAAESLGKFGPKAMQAEPALRRMLEQTNANVLEAVTTALDQISTRK